LAQASTIENPAPITIFLRRVHLVAPLTCENVITAEDLGGPSRPRMR
jgi:hypothetical protein